MKDRITHVLSPVLYRALPDALKCFKNGMAVFAALGVMALIT